MTTGGPVTPAVIDKTVVDIDFSAGVNEYVRAESLDWTKNLRVADNVDFNQNGVLKARRGLVGVANHSDSSTPATISPLLRLMSTGSGVLAYGSQNGSRFQAYQLNENAPSVGGNAKASLTAKGPIPEYALYPKNGGSVNGIAPLAVGSVRTARYDINVITPNGIDYSVYFIDLSSSSIVRSYVIGTGFSDSTAGIALVSGRYLHVYAGTAASAKVWQFDCEALPDSVPGPVTLTSGSYIVAALALTSKSTVVMRNAHISSVNTSGTESATGSVSGFDTNALHDAATDGTNLYIVGVNSTPRGLLKVLNGSLSTTRTVTDTSAATGAGRISVGVDPSGNCSLLSYRKYTPISTFVLPTTCVLTCSSSDVAFNEIQVLPGWGAVSSPFYNAVNGDFYAAMANLVDAGFGAGYDLVTATGGTVALINLTESLSWPLTTPPAGYHVACTLDAYIDYVGNNSTSFGSLVNTQHIHSPDGGYNLVISSIQRLAPQSFASELRHMAMNDSRVVTCATDVISGGRTSSYDGLAISEIGCLSVPWIVALDHGSGTGVDTGLRNYVAVFESVDAQGRRHLSRISNPFAISKANSHDVDVAVNYPNLSDHVSELAPVSGTSSTTGYAFKVHVYRTVAGGTQYFRLRTQTVTVANNLTTYITFVDSVSDASLAGFELLYRQPGTLNTPLDRYSPTASSCCVRHKDRVFIARGNDVYYSSFDVFGEAPWFNPAFTFKVIGGVGDIVAMSSIEGLLVVFKENAIFVVDGDGPPESGGNGTEFSPPRKLMTELGCTDARTVVSTDDGIMFLSSRGLELLDRNLTVSWIGRNMVNTLATYPYPGGGAFDTTSGRCVWVFADTLSGVYPGQISSVASGVVVVYDINSNAWSRYKLNQSAFGYGYAYQDVTYADVGASGQSIASAGRLAYIDTGQLYLESGHVDVVSTGTNVFIPLEIQVGWVKGTSKQDRLRVTDLMIAAIRNANCTVTASYAADYSPSWITPSSWVWTPSVTSALTFVQLNGNVPKEAVQAISFKLVTSDPTPTSFGDGSQMDIFGLSVRVGMRGGGAKVPVAQKG